MTLTTRLVVLAACMLGTAALAARALEPGETPLAAPLARLPLVVDVWDGVDAPPLPPEVLAQLGADDYVNRVYVAAGEPVSLYVGYYRSQREGDTIHSPQNCLPGAGWLPVAESRVAVPVTNRAAPITINRLLIQKGLDRQVVYYWYQSHGRVVASDYMSKAYLVYDALTRQRSDAAMVRVISPVLPGEDAGEADRRAVRFIGAAFPQVEQLLPI